MVTGLMRPGDRAGCGMVAGLLRHGRRVTRYAFVTLRPIRFVARPCRRLRLGHFCNRHVEEVGSTVPATSALSSRNLPDKSGRGQFFELSLHGVHALLGVGRQHLLRWPATAIGVGVVRQRQQLQLCPGAPSFLLHCPCGCLPAHREYPATNASSAITAAVAGNNPNRRCKCWWTSSIFLLCSMHFSASKIFRLTRTGCRSSCEFCVSGSGG